MEKDRTLKILYTIKIASDYYDRVIEDYIKNMDISKCEADILLFFYNNPSCLNAKDAVKIRGFSKSYVSKAVSSLLKKGYISIYLDNKDKRYQKLSIDSKSDELISLLAFKQQEVFKQFFNGIEKDDFNIFLSVMKKIESNINYLKERK